MFGNVTTLFLFDRERKERRKGGGRRERERVSYSLGSRLYSRFHGWCCSIAFTLRLACGRTT